MLKKQNTFSGFCALFIFLPALMGLLAPEVSAENKSGHLKSKNSQSAKTALETVRLPSGSGNEKRTIAVDIYTPDKKIKADLLVLPGWNFLRTRWERETRILSYCKKYSYRCIFPEMGITLYESEYFPETTMKWGALPGGEWVKKILIPYLQKKKILRKHGNNFVLGLSTGGRGVALLSLQNPSLFKAGASLSGDFNQTAMPKDRLMSGTYGGYRKFSKRWQTVDNPENEVKKGKWKMPIYLAHGTADRVVPFEQTRQFYLTLKKYKPDLKVKFHAAEGYGHDFNFWDSELSPVFKFFQEVLK